jgi:Cas10/Cmr2, second palm domain
MTEQITALLIDTVSIQPYIFGSNKLKENIGASYIIEHEVFENTFIEIFGENFNINYWKNDNAPLFPTKDEKKGIGYIGGGNALILFKGDDQKKEIEDFIRNFSMKILQKFPGLKVAFGIKEDFKTDDNFKEEKKKLNQKLILNKSLENRNVTPFKHGIVEDCALSNEAQEVFYPNQGWISQVSKKKFDYCKKAQYNLIEDTYKSVLQDKYVFTDELDKLGQLEDKGYIAVVHIDGNGMGQKFLNCIDLDALRVLSANVSTLATGTMKDLVEHIIELYKSGGKLADNDNYELNDFVLEDNPTPEEKQWAKENRKNLPIRPIITGGDDITFVCEGRLGVYLAEWFINKLVSNSASLPGGKISACAGIAIVHTKYPFYRAYTLAEELCAKAKTASRPKEVENSSWLSYLISTSGFSGDLETILEKQFNTPNGRLTLNPYRIDTENNSINKLKDGIKHFHYAESKWPRSKVMELRDVLRQDKDRQQYYITEMEFRDRTLPDDIKTLWIANENGENYTPFYDMIELADFYPEELLTE